MIKAGGSGTPIPALSSVGLAQNPVTSEGGWGWNMAWAREADVPRQGWRGHALFHVPSF